MKIIGPLRRLIQSVLNRKFQLTFSSLLLVSLAIVPQHTYALTRWQRLLRVTIKKDAATKKALGTKCLDSKFAKKLTTYCDFDRDGFVNFRERNFPQLNGKKIRTNPKLKDTDGDGLSDYEELLRYGTDPRVADSDKDGLNDGDEVRTFGTDPLNPDSDGDGVGDGQDIPGGRNCGPSNFDADGNTVQFEIPSGQIGNKDRGQRVYGANCQACHAALEHGTNLTYPQLEAAITGATGKPMNVHLSEQDLADLTAWLNRSQVGGTELCPTPTPNPVSPSPTPTIIPTATPTACQGGSQNFDAQGNTGAFGIAPLIGNISSGQSQYSTTCVSCHVPANGEKGTGYTFPQLKTAFMSNPFMNGTYSGPVALNDQQIANLVAFLNRNNTGGCMSSGTPTPTPTPNPISQGSAIFAASCAQCHGLDSQGHPHEMDRHPPISSIHSALWNGPDAMPQFRSLTLGQSAPPYSASEYALWAYLNSLP